MVHRSGVPARARRRPGDARAARRSGRDVARLSAARRVRGRRGGSAIRHRAVSLVTGVAIVYAEYQGLRWVHDVFLGIGPAVLAIIAIAAAKLARSTNKSDPVLWAIAVIL